MATTIATMDIQLNPCPHEAPTLEFSQSETSLSLENISYITDSSIKCICDLFDQLMVKLKIDSENLMSIKLSELRHNTLQLTLLAPKYDYSPTNPGNGYRSFVKLIIQFISKWLKKFSLHKIQYQHLPPGRKDVMLNIVNFLITLSNLFILIDSKVAHSSPECVNDFSDLLNVHHSSIDPIVLKTLLSIDSATLFNFLNEFDGPFWLSSNLDLCLKIYSRLVTFYSSPGNLGSSLSPGHLLKLLLNINDEVTKANVKFTLSGTVVQVKKLWSFYGQKLNYPLILASNSFKIPKIRKMVKIERRKMFRIENNKIIFNSSSSVNTSLNSSQCTLNYSQCDCNCNLNCNCDDFGKDNRSKCQVSTTFKEESNEIGMLLLHDNHFGKSPNDTVVLHLHGGGFVSIKPKCHEIYLRKWSSNLSGVPIVSVDYSLSPQVKYPTALEEILEVYLYLIGFDASPCFEQVASFISGDHLNVKGEKRARVHDLLGFVPKNIILFGDSAGSNLSLSLLHVLHDLNQLLGNNLPNFYLASEDNLVCYPKALFLPYPHANATLDKFTPSRIFLAIDPILPFGSFYSLSEAYTPDAKCKCDRNNNYFESFDTGEMCRCETGDLKRQNNGNNGDFAFVDPRSCDKEGAFGDELRTNGCRDAVNGNNNNNNNCNCNTSHNNNRPWYKPPEVCSRRLAQIERLNLGKYFNPLSGPFDHFSSIPLFIQVGEFDPLLDESIAIASKWRGECSLLLLTLPFTLRLLLLHSHQAWSGPRVSNDHLFTLNFD